MFYLQLPNLVCGRRGRLPFALSAWLARLRRRCAWRAKAWLPALQCKTTIENTQDIGTYFTGYGFEVDLSTAAVDKVKIPKSGTTALLPLTRWWGKRPDPGGL